MPRKPDPRENGVAISAPLPTTASGGPQAQPVARRRALRAALTGVAAALGGVMLLGRQPETASAANGTFDSSVSGTPAVKAAGTNGADGVDATSDTGNGVSGSGSTGVTASGSNTGVYGTTTTSGGIAVWGQSTGTAATIEGDNFGSGPGVYGTNTTGNTAVLGLSSNGTDDSSVGVYGKATGSHAGIGVLGLCSNDSQSVGLYGQSATGTGFLGFSNATGGVGATGINSTSGIGLYGVSAGGYAGLFSGNVYVTGNLTVVGSFPKSAAVRGGDGGLKRLYCMESPECWFEDFGTGQLTNGSGHVQIDPGFGELVHGHDYHVFLTPRGDSKGLYVGDQNSTSFTVHEQQGGTSSLSFSYRLVAKRKDIPGVRLEAVEEPPKPPTPHLTSLPPTPPTPPVPKLPGHIGH
jgi:hypothetical protein